MDYITRALADIDPMIAGVAILALLVLVLIAVVVSRGTGKDPVKRVLKRIGCEYLADVTLPDGIGGMIHVDYLVVGPRGLLVLDLKNYKGHLFGAANIGVWTQMLRSGSYKFKNPLQQNAVRVQAVKLLAPEVPVGGRVVFTNDGDFPKGVPEGVVMLDALGEHLGAGVRSGEVPPRFRQALEAIRHAAVGAGDALQGVA